MYSLDEAVLEGFVDKLTKYILGALVVDGVIDKSDAAEWFFENHLEVTSIEESGKITFKRIHD